MKYKNISLLEAHIEKLVFALALILAALIFWSYVINDPYEVALQRNPQPMSPEEVEKKIVEQAEQLNQQVSKEESNVPAISVPNYTDEFRKRLIEPISDPETTHRLGPPGLDEGLFVINEEDAAVEVVIVPEPPAPTDIIARHSFGVLSATGNTEAEQALRQMVDAPADGPLDFHYATVAATYDLAKWRDRLRNGPRPAIEEAWWRNLLAITGVILERSTFDPASNSWGPVQRISPLPTQLNYLAMQGPFLSNEAKDLIRDIKDNQDRIARPDFVQLAAGPAWLPPDKDLVGLSPEDQQRVLELDREIADIERRIQQQNQGAQPQQPKPKGNQAGMNMGPGAMGDDEGLFGGAGVNNQSSKLQQEIDEKKRERAAILGKPLPQQNQPEPFAPAEGGELAEGEEIDPMTVWAHDLTVEPGKTYRYRILVPVLNPLFQRQNLAPQQRDEHLHKLSLVPEEASAWSEPVTIPPQKQFFVIRTNERQNTATFEVWRIFNGRHVFHTFTVQRGDEIGGPVQMGNAQDSPILDLSVGAVLVDLNFDVPVAPTALGAAKSTSQALLMEEGSGTLFKRTEAEDTNSADRATLRLQARTDSVARTDEGGTRAW